MEILRNQAIAQQRDKRHYNDGRVPVTYKEGENVYLYFAHRQNGKSESLVHRWVGPYSVIRRIRPTTYELLCLSNHCRTCAHVSRLRPGQLFAIKF